MEIKLFYLVIKIELINKENFSKFSIWIKNNRFIENMISQKVCIKYVWTKKVSDKLRKFDNNKKKKFERKKRSLRETKELSDELINGFSNEFAYQNF